jgi:hypothetical protein
VCERTEHDSKALRCEIRIEDAFRQSGIAITEKGAFQGNPVV